MPSARLALSLVIGNFAKLYLTHIQHGSLRRSQHASVAQHLSHHHVSDSVSLFPFAVHNGRVALNLGLRSMC